MRAIRKEQLQPRPTVRNLLNALARWFQAVLFRVVDDASPLRDLVVIRIGDPNAALGDEPLDQLMSLRPPGPRDGPLAVGRSRAGERCRLTSTSDRRVVVESSDPTIPQGIGRAPVARHPGSTTLAGNEAIRLPVLPYRAERRASAVGVSWDFPVASGPIKRHERETAELIAAGHRVHWPLPGHLTSRKQQLRPERRPPSTPHRHSPSRRGLTCPADLLTPHQIERQMSVTSVISASRYRP